MPKAISNENFEQIWGNIKNLLNKKVDKEAGKGLSSNDFTSVYRSMLDSLNDTIDQKITNRLLQAFPVGTIIETENSTNPSSYIGGTWAQYGAGQVTVGIDPSDPDFDAVGKTGGSKDLQEHDHDANATNAGDHTHAGETSTDGLHYHSVTCQPAGNHTHTGTAASAGSHSHSASSGSAGSHSHITPVMKTSVEANGFGLIQTEAFQNRPIVAGDSSAARGTTSTSSGSHSHTITVNSAGAHTHSVSTNSTGAHTHIISLMDDGNHKHTLTVDEAGNHAHDITVQSAGTGDSGNLQPYITVYKWIRTS